MFSGIDAIFSIIPSWPGVHAHFLSKSWLPPPSSDMDPFEPRKMPEAPGLALADEHVPERPVITANGGREAITTLAPLTIEDTSCLFPPSPPSTPSPPPPYSPDIRCSHGSGLDHDFQEHDGCCDGPFSCQSWGTGPIPSTRNAKDFAGRKQGARGLASQRRAGSRSAAPGGDNGGGGQGGGDQGGDDEDNGGNGGARNLPLADRWEGQMLACPFYKFNSVRYMSCVRLRLSRIRDVKQHLMRRHRRPTYCPVCGEIFSDSGRWDSHITARTCSPPPGGVNIEGVTETQSLALSRRVDRTIDASRQWFSVWDILFPGHSRPLSPYLSSTQFGELLSIFHDYWEHQRDTLITEAIQSAGGDGHSGHNPLVTELSSRIVEHLFSTFRATSQTIMDPAASTANNPTVLGPADFTSSPCLLEDVSMPPPTSNVLSTSPSGDPDFAPFSCSFDLDLSLALPAAPSPEPLGASCAPAWPNESLDMLFLDPSFLPGDPAVANSDSRALLWPDAIPVAAADLDLEYFPGHCGQLVSPFDDQ